MEIENNDYTLLTLALEKLDPAFRVQMTAYTQVLSNIGEGTFGSIAKVKDAKGALYAMKSYKFKGKIKIMLDAVREAQFLTTLTHGSMLKCFGYDYILKLEDEGKINFDFRIVTELGDGGDLSDKYKRDPAFTGIKNVLHKLIDVVDYLRKMNVIHRDLKPKNVVFVKGEPKLIDFGSAIDLDDPDRETKMKPFELEKSETLGLGISILSILAGEDMSKPTLPKEIQETVSKLTKKAEKNCKDKELLQLLSVMTEPDVKKRKTITEIKADFGLKA
jgi:serine/threonine protein kinase